MTASLIVPLPPPPVAFASRKRKRGHNGGCEEPYNTERVLSVLAEHIPAIATAVLPLLIKDESVETATVKTEEEEEPPFVAPPPRVTGPPPKLPPSRCQYRQWIGRTTMTRIRWLLYCKVLTAGPPNHDSILHMHECDEYCIVYKDYKKSNAYRCILTGNVHECTTRTCGRLVTTSEHRACAITGNIYPLDLSATDADVWGNMHGNSTGTGGQSDDSTPTSAGSSALAAAFQMRSDKDHNGGATRIPLHPSVALSIKQQQAAQSKTQKAACRDTLLALTIAESMPPSDAEEVAPLLLLLAPLAVPIVPVPTPPPAMVDTYTAVSVAVARDRTVTSQAKAKAGAKARQKRNQKVLRPLGQKTVNVSCLQAEAFTTVCAIMGTCARCECGAESSQRHLQAIADFCILTWNRIVCSEYWQRTEHTPKYTFNIHCHAALDEMRRGLVAAPPIVDDDTLIVPMNACVRKRLPAGVRLTAQRPRVMNEAIKRLKRCLFGLPRIALSEIALAGLSCISDID